jgi:Concanavalin A-like lectin/glucanases superfamily
VLDAAALKLTGDVTVSAWIRPASLGRKQSIVSKRYELELGWIHDVAPYALKWSHKESGGGLVSGDLTASTEAGQWQHVVLVRDAASKQVRGYKNGVLGVTSSYLLGPGANTYNLNLGRNPGGSQHFGGLLDEVRIYSRALTDAEVQALFSQG